MLPFEVSENPLFERGVREVYLQLLGFLSKTGYFCERLGDLERVVSQRQSAVVFKKGI